ncbi:threonylcarbamoyl-AMP synthase [Phlebotomus papatasi]|uniref:threonylcarbamoyl-AMP synthase n=1 Tax=Phlebotomus papatasi TaxID=29031 RepID=UPI002484363C|nr:threonylcarbamoyl-AMP synthase [Phlebotomus papatasi]
MFHTFKNLIRLKRCPKFGKFIGITRSVERPFHSGSVLGAEEMQSSPFVVVSTVNPSAIPLARELLAAGEVIALPTDTVYGLACDANNPEAIQKLYQIKGRMEEKPVAICVAEIEDFHLWGSAKHLPRELLQELLPGAVTLVVNKSPRLDNPFLNPGVSRIGIRIPDSTFIRDVSRAFRAPIALTSANRSTEPSSLNVTEFQPLWPLLGAVFDGGQLGVTEAQRAASTVVDLSEEGKYFVIRRGVAIQETENVLKRYKFYKEDQE